MIPPTAATTAPTRRARLRATCAALALLMLAQPAAAQTVEPPAEVVPPPTPPDAVPDQAITVAPSTADQAEAPDPPARVGRLARVQGTVSFRLAGQEDWAPAEANLPVTTGAAIWTEPPAARAAVQVGRSNFVLEAGTDLQFVTLDDRATLVTMPQGVLFGRLRGLDPGETVEVVTPRVSVSLGGAGRYLIEAPPPEAQAGQRPTRVVVYEGEAVIAGEGIAPPMRVAAGQAALIAPDVGAPPQLLRAVGAAAPPIIAWAAALEPRVAPPPSAALMTGAEDLSFHGRWDRHASYGDVWYPREVPQDWAPYRDGRWSWVEPWGWTWMDAQPWGFATSHYGRWVRIGPRWGWCPQPVLPLGAPAPRPVWAPALLTFFAGPAAGVTAHPVGWVPLGHREPYYPWYRASPAYVRNVNVRHVTNITHVVNVWQQARPVGVLPRGPLPRPPGGPGLGGPPPPQPRFVPPVVSRNLAQLANRDAATVVPATVMIASRPVRPNLLPVQPGALRQANVTGLPPVRPTPTTLGMTPPMAQRLGLPVAAVQPAPSGPVAPGPAPARHAALLRQARPVPPPSGGVPAAVPGVGPAAPAAGLPPGGVPAPGAVPAPPAGGGGSGGGGGGIGLGTVAGAAAAASAVGGALARPGQPGAGPGLIARPGGGQPPAAGGGGTALRPAMAPGAVAPGQPPTIPAGGQASQPGIAAVPDARPGPGASGVGASGAGLPGGPVARPVGPGAEAVPPGAGARTIPGGPGGGLMIRSPQPSGRATGLAAPGEPGRPSGGAAPDVAGSMANSGGGPASTAVVRPAGAPQRLDRGPPLVGSPALRPPLQPPGGGGGGGPDTTGRPAAARPPGNGLPQAAAPALGRLGGQMGGGPGSNAAGQPAPRLQRVGPGGGGAPTRPEPLVPRAVAPPPPGGGGSGFAPAPRPAPRFEQPSRPPPAAAFSPPPPQRLSPPGGGGGGFAPPPPQRMAPAAVASPPRGAMPAFTPPPQQRMAPVLAPPPQQRMTPVAPQVSVPRLAVPAPQIQRPQLQQQQQQQQQRGFGGFGR